jgi:hypothetical protein
MPTVSNTETEFEKAEKRILDSPKPTGANRHNEQKNWGSCPVQHINAK